VEDGGSLLYGRHDVHKKILAVVVANARNRELHFVPVVRPNCGNLSVWLQERGTGSGHGVDGVVLEACVAGAGNTVSTRTGGQARSNRGPHGRKTDFRDAKRSVSRLLSDYVILSHAPAMEQRSWRTLTRTKCQLTRDRVRLQSQLESLLGECQIKLFSVVSDLLGASGWRILGAIAAGEMDPARLRELGDRRLHATGCGTDGCPQRHSRNRCTESCCCCICNSWM